MTVKTHRRGIIAKRTAGVTAVPYAEHGAAADTISHELTITTAYVTGYDWWDNTPPGSSEIAYPLGSGGLHTVAGGVGTYADPITVAVGWSTASGPAVPDWPVATRFYMPYLRRYFIVEDQCGDTVPPQNGPCHDLSTADPGATTWVDIWIDGQNGNATTVAACMDALTGIHTIIVNPLNNHTVVSGSVFAGTCTSFYPE